MDGGLILEEMARYPQVVLWCLRGVAELIGAGMNIVSRPVVGFQTENDRGAPIAP